MPFLPLFGLALPFLPVFGLGLALALAGIGLFALTLRKATSAELTKPAVKKADLRVQEAQVAEIKKLRIAGAVLVAVGAVLMVIS